MKSLHIVVRVAAMLFLAGVAFAQTPPPTPPTGPLTIEEAVAFALRNNPTVHQSAQEIGIAQAQLNAAQANRRPDLVLNTAHIGAALDTSARLQASQPLWPSTRWKAPIAVAQATVTANTLALARTRQSIVQQVRSAYFGVLSAQELLQVAGDAVKVAQEQLRLANTTFEAGTAPKLDVFQATANLEAARVDETRAQNGVALAQSALAIQLGLPAATPIEVVPIKTLPTPAGDVQPLLATALSQRTELAQLETRRQQLRASMELIRLQRQPLVDAQANYARKLTGDTSYFGPDGFTYGAGITLPLYNGGQTRAELDAARQQLAQVETAARQIELGISLEVRQAWLTQQNAHAQLAAAQRQLDAANEALAIAQVRYDNGEGIILEVEQARLRRTQAQTALAQARFQAQLASAQLDFALGTPAPAE